MMTQGTAHGPREFKFVPAFGRKRNRRRATGTAATPSTRPKRAGLERALPASAAAAAATATATGCSANEAATHGQQDDHAAANLLMGLHTDAPESAPSTTDMMGETTNIPSSVTNMSTVHEPADACIPDLTNAYFDPPLNLFTDFDASLSFPISPSSWCCKFPFLPDPSGFAPFDLLGDSPSTEGSYTRHVNHQHGHDDGAMDADSMPKPLHNQVEAIPLLPSNDSGITNGNIGHTISQLLTRYDEEFCVLPLTRDFEANPFRLDSKTGRGSQLLLHCILALCYKHISRDTGSYVQEAKTHKRQAFDLLKDVENQANNPFRASFLDALLILMTLDCATSARGPWIWYLQRAHKMIEATTRDDVQDISRFQARIEMLVWWDVTLAFTSRQGCVLSEATTMSLLSPETDKTNGSSLFFSISGCPRDLFQYMVRLAAYAREFEVVTNMTCVAFDMKHVDSVREGIQSWKNSRVEEFANKASSSSSEADDAQSLTALQDKEDLYHCAEAWRNALLLYVERVFCRDRKSRSPVLRFLARRTLNHVASCRRSSMVQKQLLLPVFLSACETRDETLQEQAREYCMWWDKRTRYGMFSTAIDLAEELWHSDDPSLWWGPILDQKSRENGSSQIPRQYLFG